MFVSYFSSVRTGLIAFGLLVLPCATGLAQTIPKSSFDVQPTLDVLLADNNTHLLLAPQRLYKQGLDYSFDSLQHIDVWLLDIHRLNLQESGQVGRAGPTLQNDQRGYYSVLLAGLYFGEVVRRKDPNNWVWENFEAFIANNPVFARHYSKAPGFDTVLLANAEGSATPINSALKRVLFGSEESLHFIAHFLTTPAEIEAARNNAQPQNTNANYGLSGGANNAPLSQAVTPTAYQSSQSGYAYIEPASAPALGQIGAKPHYLPDPQQLGDLILEPYTMVQIPTSNPVQPAANAYTVAPTLAGSAGPSAGHAPLYHPSHNTHALPRIAASSNALRSQQRQSLTRTPSPLVPAPVTVYPTPQPAPFNGATIAANPYTVAPTNAQGEVMAENWFGR